ncbi:MAG: TetR/AcrR family transcriptional regulator C-terminal domain-containing protein [Oscillospiraceae bacterium]|nr:TetR/AcrR family transcriptional regulator C-terminal domain-containing protein [Oscillospiraceae bacterium]
MAQYTKKAIMEGFLALLNDKPFDKIAVVDIAERCEINRNTFYYYYADVYALVDDLLRTKGEKLLSQAGGFDSWPEVFMQVTEFARANRKAVYHLCDSSNLKRLECYLYDIIFHGMNAFVRREAAGIPAAEEDLCTLVSFYTSALLGLVAKWLQEGMTSDAEAYILSMGRLLEGNVRMILSRNGTFASQS